MSGLAGQTATLPDTPLTYGGFAATFSADGTFAIDGEGWPPMKGAWRVDGADVLLTMSEGPKDSPALPGIDSISPAAGSSSRWCPTSARRDA